MPKTTHSREYLLESLVEGESLDGVLTSLIVIAEKKAQSQHSNKVTVKQWSRTARRLKELREWCAKFGPGSDCRWCAGVEGCSLLLTSCRIEGEPRKAFRLESAATCFELLQKLIESSRNTKPPRHLVKAPPAFIADVAARADRPRSGYPV
jgi:hypothetical protein